jgi:hypothetical protein
VVVNGGSVNTDELTNCHCTSAGVYGGTYTSIYVEKTPTQDTTNALDNFDDIVTFKEGWQMQAQNFPVGPMLANCLFVGDTTNNRIRIVNGSGMISTVAGNGTQGYTGDGGAATSAELYDPSGVTSGVSGDIYIADGGNNVIRRVDAFGTITTVAGNGTSGYSGDSGAATSAELNLAHALTSGLSGLAVDTKGNLYIADTYNQVVRMVSAATGIITTVAGNGFQGGGWWGGFAGDGGLATSARLNRPSGIALDSSGNLYIGDLGNNAVRKVTATTGIISTVVDTTAAQGYSGDSGPATAAETHYPTGVAVDSSGNLYVSDGANLRIREVSAATGIITTVVGDGVSAFYPAGNGGSATGDTLYQNYGIALDSAGNIYIADQGHNAARLVSIAAGIITGAAGNGSQGYNGDNGPATSARLALPQGVAYGAR